MASIEFDDDSEIHCLEGTPSVQKGGLEIMKKTSEDNAHVFKKPPKTSLLGLDKLASAKRALENDILMSPKRSKVLSYKGDDDDDVEEVDEKHSLKSNYYKER